jgi:hypothetical protein
MIMWISNLPDLGRARAKRVNLFLGATMALLLVQLGCSSQPKTPPKPPTVPVLKVSHQVGGTNERALVHKAVWLGTSGPSLLVVDPHRAMARRTVPLGPLGQTGPATDMIVVNDQLFVVVEDDAVVQLTLDDPLAPRIVRTMTAETLGIKPRSFSLIDGTLYVCGHGGVVRLPESIRVMTSSDLVNCVAMVNGTLIACVGRQALRVDDGRFVGSASTLMDCSTELGADRALVFTRRGAQGSLVGLMTPELREVDTSSATVGFGDVVRRVTCFDGRLWVVRDTGISCYRLVDNRLDDLQYIDVLGARDVARLDGNHLAIVGVFGRAVYRINADSSGPGHTFVQAEREASGLSHAMTDGQRVLAGSGNTAWMYQINARAEITNKPMQPAPPPAREASTVEATARLSDDGATLHFTSNDFTWAYSESDGLRMTTVTAVDGDFWIGHDRGLTVLRSTRPTTDEEMEAIEKNPALAPTQPFKVIGRVRLPGSVNYLYPLLVGGGAAYVSEFGGFGVVTLVEEPVAPLAVSR